MSLATVYSRSISGVRALPVRVEIHLAGGLPGLSIVGLPETAVKESKDRVRAALINAGFEFPARRITVNLAPADLPKQGGRFDLPIALGILAASGQLPIEATEGMEFNAELGLGGELRPVRGMLPAALAAVGAGRALAVAPDNAAEAALATRCEVYAAAHLLELTAHLRGDQPLSAYRRRRLPAGAAVPGPDLADVRGQEIAKRALEVAAAGEHNLLLVGPPGTGKSMLARRLAGLLPPMSEPESLESAAIQSIASAGFDPAGWGSRPLRAPHHTASAAALVGGGSGPAPGEISLAHNGVLFLDELPEFDRRVLEVLRQPLETGRIVISRAARQAEFPARFQLVAAMNPCPCGHYGDTREACRCSQEQVRRYQGRVSGPLLDRIDIQVLVQPPAPAELFGPGGQGEASAQVQARVVAARQCQLERQGCTNARLENRTLERCCAPSAAATALLESAVRRLRLSARAYHRVLKLARTIADLGGSRRVDERAVAEAVGYRSLERNWLS